MLSASRGPADSADRKVVQNAKDPGPRIPICPALIPTADRLFQRILNQVVRG
jgi:hypothetical protein